MEKLKQKLYQGWTKPYVRRQEQQLPWIEFQRGGAQEVMKPKAIHFSSLLDDFLIRCQLVRITESVSWYMTRSLKWSKYSWGEDTEVTASLFNLSLNFSPERIQFGHGSLCWIHGNTSWFHSVFFVLFVLLMYYCNSFSVGTWDGPPLASCLIFDQVFV